ncbi:DNA/RNA-binding protein KIN17 [Centruroides vittatus]|uniref:DNA/RNA-binding protein KIN17 n=1 Tax=Centruroides vittatus TaxID=120091 RepID=UPI00350EF669
MPKHEPLTPKAIANRIKAKGLQKLRWYCQMCQKQCRDENGFKCHTTSESHQRQLLLFAENPYKYIDRFSKEFLDTFIELLSRRFGTKRVHANQVYQEYISDRHHLHMNATRWETLTDFVKWLGREGHCVVDYTDKGWFISYIDRDPETIRRQEALAKKEKMNLDDEERIAKFIEKQIERDKGSTKDDDDASYSELKRDSEGEKVAFSLTEKVKEKTIPKAQPLSKLISKPSSSNNNNDEPNKQSNEAKKRKNVLDEIIEEQEKRKEKINRKDHWLAPGIVVKVITKKMSDKYYKKKGVITDIKNQYVGIVKMLDGGDVLKLDQVHLETVIPAFGKQVLILNGAYRGCEGILQSIQQDKFCATIKISSGPSRGRVVEGIAYEDFSKLHTS